MRLDERMAAMDHTSERIFAELAGIREDMRTFRAEVRSEIRDLRSDLNNFQDRMVQVGFGLLGVTIASIAAILIALISGS